MRSLKDISLNISEEEYRKMPELSYSTLAKYERGGFDSIPNLFDRIESPSLTFGSAVDSIITGGIEEFNDRFIVAEFPSISDSIITIVKYLFNLYKDSNRSLSTIKDEDIINATIIYKYQLNWKPETRAKVIKEKGEEYYNLLYLSDNKTILSISDYSEVLTTVDALKTSPSTKWYFTEDNPFDNIRRYYQLKFKAEFEGVGYRCMADLIIVDYDNKLIIPVDLKTSGHKEYEFHKSFIDWSYQIQARLYWRIIRDNLDRDPYFKDFELANYKFIVVNKRNKRPLVWKFINTTQLGDMVFGKEGKLLLRDPFTIGKELKYYLDSNAQVPIGINESEDNDISEWLNKL